MSASESRDATANLFAQTDALMRGRTRGKTVKEMGQAQTGQFISYKVYDDNRPSNAILLWELTLYAHRIFVEVVIWNLNSCDQWGLEPGQKFASRILPELHADAPVTGQDDSTHTLINYYRRMSPARTDL